MRPHRPFNSMGKKRISLINTGFKLALVTYIIEFIQGRRIFMDIKPLIELTLRNDFSLKKFSEKLTKTRK